ncbi:G5 domain-containing protein [Acetobacterium malicum]|uniref:G5 domain-containing protein n=1 Tax=Acetobacterium malicum TaxID=52692 RepID=UPI00359370C6
MNRERETGGFLKKYPGVKIGIIALILLLVVGVSSAFTVEKEVQVNFEGKVYTANGKLLESLEEVLIANDLPVSDKYKYSTPLTTLFKDVIDVTIEEKVSGKILVDGKTISYLSGGATVGDVLEENGVKPDEDDKVEPGSNSPLTEKTGDIKVTRISYVESTGIKDVPMKATIVENPELPAGTRIVVQVGQNGKANKKEKIRYENGVEVSREVITCEVIMPAVEEIIEVGPSTTIVMPEAVEVTSVTGNVNVEKSATGDGSTSINQESGFKGSMVVSATAYTATGNNTASGTVPQSGRTIATWGGIPFGTQVYIPALGGIYTVEDRGGAVGYGIIDIYMDSEEACEAWGRQNIEIYFVE